MGGSLRSDGGERSLTEDEDAWPHEDPSLVSDSLRGEGSAELAVEPELGASRMGIAGSLRSSERRRSTPKPPKVGGAGTSRRMVALRSIGGRSRAYTGGAARGSGGGPPDE